MARLSIGRCGRSGMGGVGVLLTLGLLAACGHHQEGGKPALQGAPAASASTHSAVKQPFALLTAGPQSAGSNTAIALHFSAALASAQTFDQQIAVTGPNGEVVNGSWSLQDDGKTLNFPFVSPNRHYAVLLHAGLLAADGRTLGHEIKRDVYSGNLQAAVGFASMGSVLPARGSRGLPLVSVNVHDADIEFFRVHDDALSDLFCAYPTNKHRDDYELDHQINAWNRCEHGDRMRRPITDITAR